MNEKVKDINMSMIDRPVKIARELIDPEKIRELAESIREIGLLQPIILRPSNGRYEIVAGDRRYLAHKLLGAKKIKAIVKELDDRETVVTRGTENIQRENLTPSEEGQIYLSLRQDAGLSPHQIAKRLGRSPATIDRYLRFIKCPEEVRKVVDQKKISLVVLEIFLEIEDPDTFKYYLEMAATNGATERVARLWVDDYFKTKVGNYYSINGGNQGAKVGEELKPTYATCGICHGPVEIRYIKTIIACNECSKKVRNFNEQNKG